MKRLLLIDNYDSFTYNLKQLIMVNFNGEVVVKRNDEINIGYIDKGRFHGLVISPGPRKPSDSGISIASIREFSGKLPILGVCLGMQCINEVFQGRTVKAPLPVHGKTSTVRHSGSDMFRNVPGSFLAARYHSLIIEKKSDDLIITAETGEGIPMAIEHRSYPIFGVQFHPESFMTEYGNEIIRNYLEYLK
jgi:anthranilate synthase/aminodeoxychorismate synthase-like glutamine amidotransferase